jgi:hypothetical protein
MKAIEVQLRAGMAERGISGAVADRIVLSIGSFALYGFPESHAASFALIAYASAYLKAHYPSAFYTALLNNQPMGFYHQATLVKDAQRRGVRFAPIDVQASDWDCRVDMDGSIRLGLRFVAGLRADVGQMIARRTRARGWGPGRPREIWAACGRAAPLRCPSAVVTTRPCSKPPTAAVCPPHASPNHQPPMGRAMPSPGPRASGLGSSATCARTSGPKAPTAAGSGRSTTSSNPPASGATK